MKFYSKFKHSFPRKCIYMCCLPSGSHFFFQVSMCLKKKEVMQVSLYFFHPIRLTHCGLMMPYNIIDLGHHWFHIMACCLFSTKPLITTCHQVNSRKNVRIIVEGIDELKDVRQGKTFPWYQNNPGAHFTRISCQKGPTCHAYAWQIGPFWQDTPELRFISS